VSVNKDGVNKLAAPGLRRLWPEEVDHRDCRRGIHIEPHAHAGSRLARKMSDRGSLLGKIPERNSWSVRRGYMCWQSTNSGR
jgi:hypothetical protein